MNGDRWEGPLPPARRPGESVRDWVFRRDEYRCVYCAEILGAEQLTLDHVEPRMRGGDDSEGNLVAACRECNARKAGAPAWAFLAENAEERENFFRHATHVWPRLLRAVREAAAKRDRKHR